MSLTHGMNVDEIESVGRRLQSHFAEELRRISREVDALVRGTAGAWDGPDGEAFRSWWPNKRTMIAAAAEDIHGFGQAALNNASEQRNASDDAGSSTGAGPRVVGAATDAVPNSGRLDTIGRALGTPAAADLAALVQRTSRDALMLGTSVSTMSDLVDVGGANWLKAGPKVGGAADLLGIATSTWTGVDAALHGDTDTAIRSAIDLAWIGAGKASPHLAAGKAAWDVGYFIGDRIYDGLEVIGVNDWFQSSVIDDAITRDFNGVVPQDFGQRYDGFSGFGTFVSDSATSMLGKAKFW